MISPVQVHFAQPWFLILLFLLPILGLWQWKFQRISTLRFSDVRLLIAPVNSWHLRLRWLPDAGRYLVFILLICSLARPQASRQREIIHGKGVDIVLALDVSGSMAALDFEPENRLQAAKQVIDEFILDRQYDRIGIVVFAREAFSQCPPTFDYAVLHHLLSQVELAPDLGIDDGTAVGMGISQAAAMLQESDAKSKIIILLTDGVNNAGLIDPVTAAQVAAALGIKVYTIGMGKPGQVPFPVDTIFGQRTQMIESEIDEEKLREIADITGALYYRATDTTGLREVYDDINALEKSDVEVQIYTRYRELAVWFLVPAILLIVLEFILRRTRFRTLP
ncbi:MAG: VWA domain-containing protein [Anaerolineae bacterium]|nr:VWA domain-containing protein [Anaerolineae bacterium]